ncbi:hypothetical protein [Paenibacillus donghaensis]|uniref:Uncharacterized protein n=1 Tax=Paenibacillus donghaensis TaxID=414771 RepID=A0A2Z2KCN5_9BACL|nr:hypothetical protein [Paenibacillus donghaensis]ASA23644.1 hypothetical protein B9T62_24335 [Paenibacillus donghaensis]
MSRFGKKLVVLGIWAGIGILLGMQFSGGSGVKVSELLPGTGPMPGVQSGQVQPSGSGQEVGGTAQGGQKYVYVPMVVDPATGAYTAVPVQPPAAGELPQQEAGNYSTLTPEQLLVPEEQSPTVDVLADKTAGLLQQASQKGIRWVVSLFDSAAE